MANYGLFSMAHDLIMIFIFLNNWGKYFMTCKSYIKLTIQSPKLLYSNTVMPIHVFIICHWCYAMTELNPVMESMWYEV